MRWLTILLGLLLTACVATGVQVSPDQASRFQQGKTTYAQVIAALGQPTSISVQSDGTRIAGYTYMESHTRPETFIPLIGGLVGGADTKMSMATFTFGPDGVLKTYTSTASQFGTGMGAASGASTQSTPDQPRQLP